jgi:hypothetical protein
LVLPFPYSGAGAFGRAQVQARGNPRHRHDGFHFQAGGKGHFGGVAFEAEAEIGLCPPQALEFFGDDALGFGGGTFLFQATRVAFVQE